MLTNIQSALFATALILAPHTGNAFEISESKLYYDAPELMVEPMMGSEAIVFAIIEGSTAHPQVLYVITYNHKGEYQTLGSFRCDLEFEVLETSNNGMYDIKCVRQNIFGEKTETVLQKSDGGYIEVYSD